MRTPRKKVLSPTKHQDHGVPPARAFLTCGGRDSPNRQGSPTPKTKQSSREIHYFVCHHSRISSLLDGEHVGLERTTRANSGTKQRQWSVSIDPLFCKCQLCVCHFSLFILYLVSGKSFQRGGSFQYDDAWAPPDKKGVNAVGLVSSRCCALNQRSNNNKKRQRVSYSFLVEENHNWKTSS